ncbi:hypothetical protein V8E36_008102 [Tilletia maclaganii]
MRLTAACCIAQSVQRRSPSIVGRSLVRPSSPAAAAAAQSSSPSRRAQDSQTQLQDGESIRFNTFSDPSAGPLSPGLLDMVRADLGPRSKPTVIQTLALKHFFPQDAEGKPRKFLQGGSTHPTETLIASETGSGKSLAYLLPLIHHLKKTEPTDHSRQYSQWPREPGEPLKLVKPRAIILAPTHELANQLATSAKKLCHIDKLKVLSLSSPGVQGHLAWIQQVISSPPSAKARNADEKRQYFEPKNIVPDILVCTPRRLLLNLPDAREFNDYIVSTEIELEQRSHSLLMTTEQTARLSQMIRQRKLKAAFKHKKRNRKPSKADLRAPNISLEDVRVIVIDEADVLLAPDYGPSTRAILHLANKAQTGVSPLAPAEGDEDDDAAEDDTPQGPSSSKLTLNDITSAHPRRPRHPIHERAPPPTYQTALDAPTAFPFDIVLATATIPTPLASYLRTTHPGLTTIATKRLHKLPTSLETHYVDPKGNKFAAIALQLRNVLSQGVQIWETRGGSPFGPGKERREGEAEPLDKQRVSSKVLIFVNRIKTAELLSDYLTEAGIENIAITSQTGTRNKGSNAHIRSFLRQSKLAKVPRGGNDEAGAAEEEESAEPVEDEEQNEAMPEAAVEAGTEAAETFESQEDSEQAREREQMEREERGEAVDKRPRSSSNPTVHGQPGTEGGDGSASGSPIKKPPRVLITTSLLSRGLDFDPSVTHVFLPDRIAYSTSSYGAGRLASSLPGTPADSSKGGGKGKDRPAAASAAYSSVASSAGINELELLHRAGRAARAGQVGHVVIFDKRAAEASGGSSSGGGSAGDRSSSSSGFNQRIKNKAGKMVYRPAVPLRRAVQALKVQKSGSGVRWGAGPSSGLGPGERAGGRFGADARSRREEGGGGGGGRGRRWESRGSARAGSGRPSLTRRSSGPASSSSSGGSSRVFRPSDAGSSWERRGRSRF